MLSLVRLPKSDLRSQRRIKSLVVLNADLYLGPKAVLLRALGPLIQCAAQPGASPLHRSRSLYHSARWPQRSGERSPHSESGIYQELLLDSYDHARPCYPHPTDQSLGLEMVFMHDVAANQSTCATKSSSAVDSYRMSCSCYFLHNLDEFFNYALKGYCSSSYVIRARSIQELHVVHLDALLLELQLIVHWFVQPDYCAYLHLVELLHESRGRQTLPWLLRRR